MTSPLTHSTFLSVKNVAERLHVTSACVYGILRTGKLRYHRVGVGRGTIRVSEEDLAAYLADCVQEERSEKRESTPRPKLKHITL